MSATSDGDNDFEPITVSEQGFAVCAARHDLAVLLDGFALAATRKATQDIRHVEGLLEAVLFAVHGHMNHGRRMIPP
jgi:hypothetical protein